MREYRQMAFLSGPRQVGKTTSSTAAAGSEHYLNWDKRQDQLLFAKGPEAVASALGVTDLASSPVRIVFDEIHKYGRWKTFLKGFFDAYEKTMRLVVTGSARLSVYKKGGDSLLGRYFPYRMHPLSIREISDPHIPGNEVRPPVKPDGDIMPRLLRFGGFPEPFLKNSSRFYARWSTLRRELLIREDVRDLTHIHELGQLEILEQLVESMAGQLVNYTHLASEVNVTVETIQRWIKTFEALFVCFTVRPWFRNVRKSLRKQPKLFLWDWSSATDPGARRENLVASHLLKAVHAWEDLGMGKYELHYLRDKAKREVDFLVARNGQPWFLVEVKSSSQREINPNLDYFQKQTGAQHAFQVVFDAPFVDRDCFEIGHPLRVPVEVLLSQLV